MTAVNTAVTDYRDQIIVLYYSTFRAVMLRGASDFYYTTALDFLPSTYPSAKMRTIFVTTATTTMDHTTGRTLLGTAIAFITYIC